MLYGQGGPGMKKVYYNSNSLICGHSLDGDLDFEKCVTKCRKIGWIGQKTIEIFMRVVDEAQEFVFNKCKKIICCKNTS